MNLRQIAIGLALLAGTAAPALAQQAISPVPQNNASLSGSEGPASNSAGYPSAADRLGDLQTTNVGPQVRVATPAPSGAVE